MFYSVDILTRKGRLGLIWLAATYGESKRGLTHREYRKVNISRACRDIVDPVVPFALRLSSTLMVGVVRIYREQTKTVWVEVGHIWRTLKNASALRVKEIDLPNPALKEEAITDSLDFITETFRWDLEVHSVAFLGPEGYFTVNGMRIQSPISPPVGQFSPPSLPGTPVPHESPGFLQEWRVPSSSNVERSPYQARVAAIRLPEVSHVRTREEEPIKIPGEIDITGEDISTTYPSSPSQPQPRPEDRSPRARSRSPRALSRSPRARSRSPRVRSKSPTRPRDEQPTAGTGAPVPEAEPLDDEPSAAQVLMMNEKTGELGLPEEPGLPDLPTSVREQYELAVPTGFVTPGVPVVTATPSPPKKRRRMPIDNVIKLSNNVIQRNVDTEGRDTLRERRLDEYFLKSAKDLFMEPTTEALCSFPFLDLWNVNAVTTPEEYHSSDAGESGEESPDLPGSPLGESVEVPRSMETPSEKEIARAAPHEGSGLFERSAASTEFTPELQESGLRPRDLTMSGDRGIRPDIEMEPTAPRGRSSSLLRSSITGLLSPIQEPSDWEEPMDIGELATVMEQSEVTLPLETEQAYDTWRLVSKALGDSDGSVVFSYMWPSQKTSRKSAVKAFYHLLVLHKNGVFQLKQRDPYRLTNIHIHIGVNF